jgi:hypothetical protein
VFIRKDGSFFPVVYSSSPIRSEGAIIGVVVAFRDVTEDKQAQETLEESRARLEGIVGSAMDAIITIDAGQRVVLFNAAAEKMFGCPAAEALGSSIDRFIPARFRQAHHKHVRGFGETGTTSRAMGTLGALSALRADGEEFPIEASISQVEVRGRKLFTVILRDVTERTHADAATAQRARVQAAVADLSQHALAGTDLDRLMKDAVALAAQILEVEFAKILELTTAQDEFVLCAGVGWREGSVGTWRVDAGAGTQSGYTLLKNWPVVVEDLAEETRFRPASLLAEHGISSGLTVVIQGRARSTQRRIYSGNDVHFLQSIADVLASAIERRQLEAELLDSIRNEQRRIGQDLHDGLCQHLSGVAFRADALAADLPSDSAAQAEVAKIADLIRVGNQQARMLSRGLTPVELEANGLMSALEELAAHSAQLHRIDCRFRCKKPLLLTNQSVATHLYRIAQEAISNAVRHARAKKIIVELRHSGDEGVLTITNDGAPLPPKPRRSGGMGLHIMEYRAELIGASLRLGSTDQGRTDVICRFRTDRQIR